LTEKCKQRQIGRINEQAGLTIINKIFDKKLDSNVVILLPFLSACMEIINCIEILEMLVSSTGIKIASQE